MKNQCARKEPKRQNAMIVESNLRGFNKYILSSAEAKVQIEKKTIQVDIRRPCVKSFDGSGRIRNLNFGELS